MESSHRIEIVRGRLAPELRERVISFWLDHGALDATQANERIDQVVCLLVDRHGQIAGVNSVVAAIAPLVARRFWMYRRFAPGADEAAEMAMINAAYEELAREYTGRPEEPLGVCVMIVDRAVIARNREAVSPETGLVYAGYTDRGAQVRIRYFDGAQI